MHLPELSSPHCFRILSVTDRRSDEWIDIQTKNLVCNIGKQTKKEEYFL